MAIELRDYQEEISTEAAGKLLSLGIVYLSMQVRTGKTFTALAVCDKMAYKKALFVTKKKAIKGIEKDVEEFEKVDVDVISMDSIHKVENPAQYDVIIADEAHEIGGAFPKPSKRAKGLKAIVGKKPLIMLSGTPSPESYSQLFHQFYVSEHTPFGNYRNFYAWAKDFVNIKQRRFPHGVVNDYSEADKDKILGILDKYFISFSQKEANFKCEVEETVLFVDMQPKTMQAIAKLKKDKVLEGKNGVILADTPAKLLSKVHQMSSGTIIPEEDKAVVFDYSKAEYIKEHFKGLRKAIFYKYTAEYQMLKEVFGESLCDDVETFREGRCDNIALQIRAGSTGINLSEADVQIFLNIDFSAKDYIQAKARLQTQKREKVNVYFLFSRGGVEKDIYDILQTKKSYTSRYYKQQYF